MEEVREGRVRGEGRKDGRVFKEWREGQAVGGWGGSVLYTCKIN